MTAADECRVNDCHRRAAASIVRDHLPGPLRLCATHTEAFRQNYADWDVVWERRSAEPTSVRAPTAASVGRASAGSAEVLDSPHVAARRVRSWLALRRKNRP
jgi:hypothetical protein